MATHLNKSQSEFDPPPFPIQADDSPSAPVRDARFAATLAGFADVLAPRRRVIRDPIYGVEAPVRQTAPAEVVHFSAGEWTMIVVAGMSLGVVLTLMLAGT